MQSSFYVKNYSNEITIKYITCILLLHYYNTFEIMQNLDINALEENSFSYEIEGHQL